MEKYYKNTGNYFLILILFIALGFYYPYFSLFPQFKSVTTTVHVHAISLMLWALILITQPILIRYEKYKAHKIIGRFTYFLVPVVILTCFGVMRQQYYEGLERKMTSAQSLKSLFAVFHTSVLSIIIFYVLAIVNVLKGNIAISHALHDLSFFAIYSANIWKNIGLLVGFKDRFTQIPLRFRLALLLSLC